MRRFILTCILMLSCVLSFAQDIIYNSDTLEVYFRQGKSTWEPRYMDNDNRMKGFVERFRKLREDRVMSRISKIYIVAGCSPEGSWALNQRLSANRAKRIRNVLKQYIDLPDSTIVENSRGVNWEGLLAMVEADPNVPNREEVIEIIKNTPELSANEGGRQREMRKEALMWRFGGKPWKYMYQHFFPTLRVFNLQIVIEWELLRGVKKYEPSEEHVTDYVSIPMPFVPEWAYPVLPSPVKKPPFYMAVKNNMLYDACLVPNIGVEFYLGKNFSLAGNWMYAWWKSDPSSWYHRIYGGDIELRRYFGKKAAEKPLQGWHAGVYGQIVTYDFEWGGRGYLGDRWSYAGGVSVGYSLPVRRRLNIDFNLGIGYLGGKYKEYLPIDDCYVWQATKHRHWLGITKLEASLVWLIGRGNVNHDKKGGNR